MRRTLGVSAGLALALLAGCGDSTDTNPGGPGGGGGANPTATNSSTGTSSSSGGGSTTTSSTGEGGGTGGTGSTSGTGGGSSGGYTCDDIGDCFGDGFNPGTGCYDCAIYGDSMVAADGGECQDEHLACFGTTTGCTDGNPDCCALSNCVFDCAFNDSACEQQCFSAHPNGVTDYTAIYGCIFDEVCLASCS
jgi:hypothetical protein